MRTEINYSNRFIKDLKKSPKNIKVAFKNKLKLFIEDKFTPALNNHSLSGKLRDYRSINITGDWRAIFRESKSGKEITFNLLGTHSKLYKN